MKAYEGGSAVYFATPPVNIIYALNVALTAITKGSVSQEERFARHRETSKKIKGAAAKLGLKQASCYLEPRHIRF